MKDHKLFAPVQNPTVEPVAEDCPYCDLPRDATTKASGLHAACEVKLNEEWDYHKSQQLEAV